MTDTSTNMTADWIKRAWANNPCKLMDDGNIRTGPVRLSFPHLFKPQPPMEAGGKEKYSATLLFPVEADLSLLKEEAYGAALDKWPNAQKDRMVLHSPFRQQSEKLKFEGYVDGGVFITTTGERKPLVVDARGAAITDEQALYPGCWVLALVRAFTFDAKMKKGVSFGLQGIIKIADDKALGGAGAPDLATAIAGINIDADVNPDALFGGSGAKQESEADVAKALFG